ncbi:MAG: periplasmic nitrate reductase, NapE protein [Pseudomonas sp.]|jgi:nitrate reductase NapE|uniref:Periplasmic nitrate reductase, NapE protein n=1 Tax=Stutzerimonas degradans TaxID=2968968 RepID=A0A1S8ETL2_9GAMM|nr:MULTISPECIES: periplasmic nitrate reductase, NapE protein [Pseudomonadaceae]MDT3710742.1 periplasmic nitrate reductase, NapE protein [Pseudomonadaceae bacterium]EKM93713.1 periplasmic nitrate reductase NapE subunit [Stutzerimonas degradans]EKM94570.1 periplasmic nitrate reductase NapE subunit [Stutzerimonas degradans]KGK81330.1 nitrate reductase [Stutzerimonas degradans]MBV2205308.1 periplasmic nitrate reductase, NapE protein [Pseudomonas sp.]
MTTTPDTPDSSPSQKRDETRLFIFLIVFLFPLLSIALVSGYGFIVWISQMFFGPPGPA